MFDPRVRKVIEEVDRLRTRVSDHWQVPSEEAGLLAQLVRLGRCRSVCEIGTSYGFSTLHLAAAARENGGHVHTIDISPKKHQAAREHLRQAGLLDVVSLHLGDAREVLRTLQPAKPFDFAFIDAVKEQSDAYLDALLPKLAARAALVTDNTTTHAAELAAFVARLRGLPDSKSCQVSVGNGFEFTLLGSGLDVEILPPG